MDGTDFMIVAGLSTGCCLITHWLMRWLYGIRADRRIGQLEKDVKSIQMAERSVKGVQARQQKAESTQNALTAGLSILANKDIPIQTKLELMAQAGLQNPEGTIVLLKKAAKVLEKVDKPLTKMLK